MTPELCIQDRWAAVSALTDQIPAANLITGSHARLKGLGPPCGFLSILSDGIDYNTNTAQRRTAVVRLQGWFLNLASCIATRNAIILPRGGAFNRSNWSAATYAVSMSEVQNIYHVQQDDGEWQLVADILLNYAIKES